jgi:hypothetical protein
MVLALIGGPDARDSIGRAIQQEKEPEDERRTSGSACGIRSTLD